MIYVQRVLVTRMNCAHCGRNTTARHRLRFTSDQTENVSKEMELELCQECLSEFLADSGIEKISS